MKKQFITSACIALFVFIAVTGQTVASVGDPGELTLTQASKAIGGQHDIIWTYSDCRLSSDEMELTVAKNGSSVINFKANDFTHAMLTFSSGSSVNIDSKSFALGGSKTLTIPIGADVTSLSMKAGDEPFSLQSITFAERLSNYMSLEEWETVRPTELTGINEPLLVNFVRGNYVLVSTLSGASPLLIEGAPDGFKAGDVIGSLSAGVAADDECITMKPDNLTFVLSGSTQTPLSPQRITPDEIASCEPNQYVKFDMDGLTLSDGVYKAGDVTLINPLEIPLTEEHAYVLTGIVRNTSTEMRLLLTDVENAIFDPVVTTIDLTDYRLAQYDSKDISYENSETGKLRLKHGAPVAVSNDGIVFTSCGNTSAEVFDGENGFLLAARGTNDSPKGFSISCGEKDTLLGMIVDADGELSCDTGQLKSTGETYQTDYTVTRYKWTPTLEDTKIVNFERKALIVGIPKIEVTHKINGGTPTSLTTTEETPVSAPRYYNLAGRQIENPASGLYIRVAGRDVEKVILN
ncbi:unknown [Prevotella sp. CAG:1031]|nr:unknown [Prevotella sp. CAG:1031]